MIATNFKLYPKQKKSKVLVELDKEETAGILFWSGHLEVKPENLAKAIIHEWIETETKAALEIMKKEKKQSEPKATRPSKN